MFFSPPTHQFLTELFQENTVTSMNKEHYYGRHPGKEQSTITAFILKADETDMSLLDLQNHIAVSFNLHSH